MKLHSWLANLGLLVALAACVPLAATYTDVEAPKALKLDNASTVVAVRFAPGSAHLLPGDAARLRALAAAGYIAPTDRVAVSAGGGPRLAAARFQSISHELLAYRIVPGQRPLADVPRNVALIDTGRYLVTMPPCPNWSKDSALGFTNTEASNFGCTEAVNLGHMVWRPADLAEGVPLGPVYTQNTTARHRAARRSMRRRRRSPMPSTCWAARARWRPLPPAAPPPDPVSSPAAVRRK
jgi:pilus assembly protein CpaD